MALSKLTTVLNTISTMDTVIRDQASTVKAELEHDVNVVKDYINNTLTPEIDILDAENVKKTGDQAIDGVKTFVKSPIVPTPTADMQTSTKKYVDDMGTNKTNDLNTHKDSADHDERYFTEAELGSIVDSDSGADKIGVTPIPTLTGESTQAVLESIKGRLDNIGTTNTNVELSNSHFGANGQTYSSVGARCDSIDAELVEVNGTLAQKASQSGLNSTNVNVATLVTSKADKSEVTNVMTPKGNIAYASLPTTGNTVGWYYYCSDGDGTNGKGNYVWNGTVWYFGGTGDEGYNLLKNDLSNITGCEKLEVTGTDKFIATSASPVDIGYIRTSSAGLCYTLKACTGGDAFTINGTGTTTGRLWCFVDSTGNILSNAQSNTTAYNLIIVAPENSAYLIINDSSKGISYYGKIVTSEIADIKTEIVDVNSEINDIKANYDITGKLEAGAYTGNVGETIVAVATGYWARTSFKPRPGNTYSIVYKNSTGTSSWGYVYLCDANNIIKEVLGVTTIKDGELKTVTINPDNTISTVYIRSHIPGNIFSDGYISASIAELNTFNGISVIDAKRYSGAVGDGIADDTECLQNTFDTFRGRTIIIPDATYLVSKTLYVHSNTTVICKGKIKLADTFTLDAIPWRDTYRYPVMKFDDLAESIIIEGLEIIGSDVWDSEHIQDGLYVTGKNHTLRDCKVHDMNYFPEYFEARTVPVPAYGVHIIQASNVLVLGGDYYNNGYEDIGTDQSENVTIIGTTCGTANRTCIQCHRGSNGISIIGNHLSNDAIFDHAVITMHGVEGLTVENIKIANNNIVGGKIHAVYANENNVVISGNRIETLLSTFIGMATEYATLSKNWVVTDNIMIGGNTMINMGCVNAIVSNNIIQSNRIAYPAVSITGSNAITNNNLFTGNNSQIEIVAK